MARGIVRAAAYLPRYSDGVRRLRGWDEDPVTLAAAALERAGRTGPVGPEATVRLVGETAGLGAAELASLLGSPVRLAPPERPGEGLRSVLEAATSGRGPEWVVVVAATPTEARAAPSPPPGDGAAALLIDDRPDAVPLPLVPSSGATDAPLAALFGSPRASPWVGDWSADPSHSVATSARHPPLDRPTEAVSQGAFVPAPRDEESRSARWRFVADRCGGCGALTFPPRGRCRGCRSTDRLRPEPLPLDRGTVVASTWIGSGGQPTEFDPQVDASGGYGVVLAELVDGVRVTLAATDAEPGELRVGARVDTGLRRLYSIEGSWRYGRKALPSASLPQRVAPSSHGGAR